MCQDMSLNPSLSMFPMITFQVCEVPLPLAFVNGNTCSSLAAYEKAQGIHSKVSVDSLLLSILQTLLWQSYRMLVGYALHILHTLHTHFKPQYLFFLSNNCIKMINTLHLLVTFTQDKCYTEYSQGENNLKFIDVVRVMSFKGKAALILQIKDKVYSSSVSLQIKKKGHVEFRGAKWLCWNFS